MQRLFLKFPTVRWFPFVLLLLRLLVWSDAEELNVVAAIPRSSIFKPADWADDWVAQKLSASTILTESQNALESIKMLSIVEGVLVFCIRPEAFRAAGPLRFGDHLSSQAPKELLLRRYPLAKDQIHRGTLHSHEAKGFLALFF